jgi:hypothetical protein
MSMGFNEGEFLLWVRGPGFVIAVAVFLFGFTLRLIEIFALGRKRDLAPVHGATNGSGWRTILTRSLPPHGMVRRSPVVYIAGYLFHIGFFVALLLFIPHIQFIRELFGVSWPGLPTPLIDLISVITILALLVVLASRLADPVKRFLSGAGDYWGWAVTFLPMVTGYMAYHHLFVSYTTMLAIHILSVELLLVSMPFGKLAHFVTLFISRWYNGEAFARRGVAS